MKKWVRGSACLQLHDPHVQPERTIAGSLHSACVWAEREEALGLALYGTEVGEFAELLDGL